MATQSLTRSLGRFVWRKLQRRCNAHSSLLTEIKTHTRKDVNVLESEKSNLLVVIESPLNADTRDGIEQNKAYAKKAMLDSLSRGEAPYASHLLYDQPGILDDLNPDERHRGILAGFAWGAKADIVA